jgi:hypothetical protein
MSRGQAVGLPDGQNDTIANVPPVVAKPAPDRYRQPL